MANISREERQRREAEAELAAKHESGEILENPRLTVEPTAENAPEPLTPAAAALPIGTPGHAEIDNAKASVEAGEVPHSPQPMMTVRFKKGYFKESGGEKIAAGTELDVPQVDGRFLIESGIAEYINHFLAD